MPQGLDLEISHHPLTMRRMVNLVIAMERLKGMSQSPLSSEFRDEDLLNIMLESIVEEQFVVEIESAPQGSFSKTAAYQCSVVDSQKRSLVLVQNMELQAVMLQGGSSHRKVLLNMSTYVNPAPSTEARPVALGIRGTNLYLSCSMDAGKPTLNLEEVDNKEQLRSISRDSEMMRFLFYKRDTGIDNSSLMSALFPDWYISTAQENNLPVEMCQQSASRYQTFTIQRQS
ncbi:interleukin-1 beta-like [Polymixia lowei]